MGSPSSPAAPEATQVAAVNAPIPVEESRAQRLQRQQARFRDRGGIFVPSNRNTLGDILCGRSAALSPRKPGKHPESVSPRKDKGTPLPEVKTSGKNVSSTQIITRRTSPRKLLNKEVHSELDDHLGPIAGSSRLHNEDRNYSKRPPASRKGKAKADVNADDALQNPIQKRRGRPPKAKLTPESNEQCGNISTKAGSKSTSKLSLKPPEDNAAKSTTKATGSGRKSKKSTKAPEDQAGRIVLAESANVDVTSDSKGKERAKEQEKSSSALEIVKTVSTQRNKRARLSDDGHSTNTTDPDPGACEAKPPISSAEHPKRSGRRRKQTTKRTQVQQRKPTPVEENSTDLAQEPERTKPASRKRPRPGRGTDDDFESGSIQASRKRPKATQRKGVESEEMTVTKISVQASMKPTIQAAPMTDIPTSKKRSRADALGGTDIESLRKRIRPALKEDTTTTDKEKMQSVETYAKDDQGSRNAKKALKLASSKRKENTLAAAAAAESAKLSKATKSSIVMQPLSKRKGPPESVLKRIKQPLPKVEDDDPDPINFLL